MAGESTAKRRDKDALLEEDLEFETTLKPAPEVTVESTLTLEELIKRRIKDAAWDDVERKDEMPTHSMPVLTQTAL
jgi:U3 small nucleolar RNA-associated protein MPP10